MTKWLFPAIAAAALPLLPAPAHAQNGVLVIYGNDKCPTDADGNEIVVCARRPETERYRIPKQLRDLQVEPENESWAVRQRATRNVGDTGIGSCSNVGPGGSTGCLSRTIGNGMRDARDRAEAADENPYAD
ncbi:hypothetical protein [Stakelama saccharophila]|uniref:DUF4124 domain-containing protein n=1 Tax=Stakelama saccharophila TaxID=3075605 RepID=A0ABZ0B8U7_9SPHN|nr:hypothetical protein [Stakelama sp. W311]WNO53803.1 hypothetical protein RPR59_00650 [Stakelama sp. W311]